MFNKMSKKAVATAVVLVMAVSGVYVYASAYGGDGGGHRGGYDSGYGRGYCGGGYYGGDHSWGLRQGVADGVITQEQADSLTSAMDEADKKYQAQAEQSRKARQDEIKSLAQQAGLSQEQTEAMAYGGWHRRGYDANLTADQRKTIDDGMYAFRQKQRDEWKAFDEGIEKDLKAAADKAGVSEDVFYRLCGGPGYRGHRGYGHRGGYDDGYGHRGDYGHRGGYGGRGCGW